VSHADKKHQILKARGKTLLKRLRNRQDVPADWLLDTEERAKWRENLSALSSREFSDFVQSKLEVLEAQFWSDILVLSLNADDMIGSKSTGRLTVVSGESNRELSLMIRAQIQVTE
jgi:hypothetical protein